MNAACIDGHDVHSYHISRMSTFSCEDSNTSDSSCSFREESGTGGQEYMISKCRFSSSNWISSFSSTQWNTSSSFSSAWKLRKRVVPSGQRKDRRTSSPLVGSSGMDILRTLRSSCSSSFILSSSSARWRRSASSSLLRLVISSISLQAWFCWWISWRSMSRCARLTSSSSSSSQQTPLALAIQLRHLTSTLPSRLKRFRPSCAHRPSRSALMLFKFFSLPTSTSSSKMFHRTAITCGASLHPCTFDSSSLSATQQHRQKFCYIFRLREASLRKAVTSGFSALGERRRRTDLLATFLVLGRQQASGRCAYVWRMRPWQAFSKGVPKQRTASELGTR